MKFKCSLDNLPDAAAKAAVFIAQAAGVSETLAGGILADRDTMVYYKDLAINLNRVRGEDTDTSISIGTAGIVLGLHHLQKSGAGA